MTNIINFKQKSNQKLNDLLGDSISPIKFTYLKAYDAYLNFKCIYTNTEKYEIDKQYSIYNLPSLFRICLTKSAIIKDELIHSLNNEESKEFAYILEWDEEKSVLIFDLNDLEYFEDKGLIKCLSKKRLEIYEYLEETYR